MSSRVGADAAATGPKANAGRRFRAGVLACAAALLFCLSPCLSPATAKTPGETHCYGGWCHRVSTLEEMQSLVGHRGILKASYYDDCRVDRFNTCGLTSSGAVFRPDLADNAASPIFPDGTVLLAFNPKTQKAAVLRINSTGPYRGDRTLDVSRATAERLGFRHSGVAELMVTVIKAPDPEESSYRKHRQYPPVPGYMGAFSSFDSAHEAALANLRLDIERETANLNENADVPYIPTRPRPDLTGIARVAIEPVPPQVLPEISVTSVVADIPPADVAPAAVASDVAGPDMPARQTLIAAGHALKDRAATDDADDALRVTEAAVPVLASREAEDWGWQWLTTFVADARQAARAPGPPPFEISFDNVSERLTRLAAEARAKARAGGTKAGPLYRLLAELKLKAQPYRD